MSAGVAIDQARHRLFVNGGSTSFPGSDTYSDAWALSLDHAPVWSKLVTDATRAPIRGGASDGYDVSRRRLVVFGGSNELGRFRNDTWLVDLRKDPAWSPLATQGTPPPPRYWHVSAWDPVRDQLVVFGGYQGDTYHPLGDLWTLSFGQGTPTWTQVVPAGPAPPGRMLTQFVYDSARDRFLLIDGFGGHSLLDDVWELRLAPSPAWRRLAPAGASPGARAAHMCVYDAARDRVLLVDGSTNDDFFSDLWALEFGSGDGQWRQLQIPPGPSARNLGLLRLETTRDRLLLFGGYGVSRVEPNVIYIDYLNDTWALDLTGGPAWRQLSPGGLPAVGTRPRQWRLRRGSGPPRARRRLGRRCERPVGARVPDRTRRLATSAARGRHGAGTDLFRAGDVGEDRGWTRHVRGATSKWRSGDALAVRHRRPQRVEYAGRPARRGVTCGGDERRDAAAGDLLRPAVAGPRDAIRPDRGRALDERARWGEPDGSGLLRRGVRTRSPRAAHRLWLGGEEHLFQTQRFSHRPSLERAAAWRMGRISIGNLRQVAQP